MSHTKPPSLSNRYDTLQSPSLITSHKTSAQCYIPSEQKFCYMKIRKIVFIDSIKDGDQYLRIAFFSLLLKSMTQPEASSRQLFDRIKQTFVMDLTNDQNFKRFQQSLEETFGYSEYHVENVLMNLFNRCDNFDKAIIGRLKEMMAKEICFDESVKQNNIIQWLERKYQTTLTLSSFDEHMSFHNRSDLISYQHKLIKQSAKLNKNETASSSDSFLSILKKDHTASDMIQITLTKSPICTEECEGVAITEFRPPLPLKRKSFWDMLCCNE